MFKSNLRLIDILKRQRTYLESVNLLNYQENKYLDLSNVW